MNLISALHFAVRPSKGAGRHYFFQFVNKRDSHILEELAMSNKLIIVLCLLTWPSAYSQINSLNEYVNAIQKHGQGPVEFVRNALTQHDLIVFDDALHSAYEPFVFYQRLLTDTVINQKIQYVFLEVLNTTSQPDVDRYLNAKEKDSTILSKAFQDDYSGYGWKYQTYLDLLATLWDVNRSLPDTKKIKAICINPPIYWEALHTLQEYEFFQNSLVTRDYFMYKMIVNEMHEFTKGEKAIFLTNTRHAYKHVRNSKGSLYWNTGTFFDQWNPGRSFSIRIHNATLFMESEKAAAKGHKSTEGLEKVVYRWARMEDGLWDKAFVITGNKSTAFSLKDNVFGKTKYIGNHMMDVAEGTSMYDAYDALLFLSSLDSLHFSAKMNFFYTPEFKTELKRRITFLYGDQLNDMLKENEVSTLDDYIEKVSQFEPVKKNNLIK